MARRESTWRPAEFHDASCVGGGRCAATVIGLAWISGVYVVWSITWSPFPRSVGSGSVPGSVGPGAGVGTGPGSGDGRRRGVGGCLVGPRRRVPARPVWRPGWSGIGGLDADPGLGDEAATRAGRLAGLGPRRRVPARPVWRPGWSGIGGLDADPGLGDEAATRGGGWLVGPRDYVLVSPDTFCFKLPP